MEINKTFETEHMYDISGDILGFKITQPYNYKVSVELDNGVILDFDENYTPVALEILYVSKLFKIPKYSLKDIHNFNMNIKISKNIIELKASFTVIIHNKKTEETINTAIGNINNFPSLNQTFALA